MPSISMFRCLRSLIVCFTVVIAGCQSRDEDVPPTAKDTPPTPASKPFAQESLVVGGTHGSSINGVRYLTVNGNPRRVAGDASIRRAAHFAFVVDPSLNARVTASSLGNTPDKFFWQAKYEYTIDGMPFTVQLAIDGRKHTLNVGNKTFHLAQGNYFRVKILPGPTVRVVQLPVVEILEDDHSKAKAVFDAHPS